MTNIIVQKSPPIGEIIFNSPENFNLIEEDTFELISKGLDEFEDNDDIKIVLIRANCGVSKKTGQKIFSAGVNLKKYNKKFELLDENPDLFKEKLLINRQLLNKIESYKKPVVIGIDGLVTGGLFELALSCDVILASNSALFSLNEANIGLIPGYGGISRLLRHVGKNKAYELIASCRKISAKEAMNLNIVGQVFRDEDFYPNTIEYCNNLATKSPKSLYAIKKVIQGILNNEKVDEIEVNAFMVAVTSDEAREKIDLFKTLDK